ncbi:non-heme ferritin [Psychrobium sp. MM17-31]|uniref:non-heme ferritin n=1 Tax=Psychrobium sp. MM17-31 TaxID=2917758 RepID=UPI001EF6C2AF|nr:non-heme ferritin [Psychrobium sp. MM17-31]MCG7532722.1 non-heme ferritin [Psychrobium sp. MM17-31]
MLSAQMIQKLNEQINLEFYSSNLYLQMSAWCEDKSFDGAATFLRKHANEEMEHMKRLFTYVSETGGLPILGAIDAAPHEFESLHDVFTQILEHECEITSKINELAHVAFTSHDYSTFNFLQWYVAEQHEEEKLFKGILDKLEMIGNDGSAMYMFDKDFAAMAVEGAGGSIMEPGSTVE